ncbi:hypothetical protein EDB85DRAFT_1891579 [Lactarius pseudohatsudake]|nr:hypothetical protein EDB85DRAFT_1891579 [Lactarius pseudohatsudake]
MRQEELHGPARISNTSPRREIRAGRMGADEPSVSENRLRARPREEGAMIKLSLKSPLPWYFPEVKLKGQERKGAVGGATRRWAEGWQSSVEGRQGEKTPARRRQRQKLPPICDDEGGGIVPRRWDEGGGRRRREGGRGGKRMPWVVGFQEGKEGSWRWGTGADAVTWQEERQRSPHKTARRWEAWGPPMWYDDAAQGQGGDGAGEGDGGERRVGTPGRQRDGEEDAVKEGSRGTVEGRARARQGKRERETRRVNGVRGEVGKIMPRT